MSPSRNIRIETEKKVVIVSPYFPPSSRAGVHRARHLAKHLGRYGWTPIVVHVEECHYLEALDDALAGLSSSTSRVIAASAIPISLTRPFGIGDLGIRGYLGIRSRLGELIEEESPDLVMITGSPFYPMLLTRFINRRGVKVVLDYQDPWRSEFNETQSIWSKRGLSHLVAKWLEPRALKFCDGVTSVSQTQNEQLIVQYPFLKDKKIAHFPIGGDPEDFALLTNEVSGQEAVALDKGHLNLVYVGAYLPRAEPLMRIFFRALHNLIEGDTSLKKRLRVTFVGTSNRPEDVRYKPVTQLAVQEKVSAVVFEFPSRVLYSEALKLLARSDGVLMIGSDERHYTASKIYPGLMSGKPYLAFFHEDSSSYDILSKAGGGGTVGISDVEQIEMLVGLIQEHLSTLVYNPENFPEQDRSAYEGVTAAAIAAGYAAFFDSVMGL